MEAIHSLKQKDIYCYITTGSRSLISKVRRKERSKAEGPYSPFYGHYLTRSDQGGRENGKPCLICGGRMAILSYIDHSRHNMLLLIDLRSKALKLPQYRSGMKYFDVGKRDKGAESDLMPDAGN